MNRDAAALVRDLVVLDFLPADADAAEAAEALDRVFKRVDSEEDFEEEEVRENKVEEVVEESTSTGGRTHRKGDPSRSRASKTLGPDNKAGALSSVRGTNDFLGVVSQLSTALSAHAFRLPPYFVKIIRALAALEGVVGGRRGLPGDRARVPVRPGARRRRPGAGNQGGAAEARAGRDWDAGEVGEGREAHEGVRGGCRGGEKNAAGKDEEEEKGSGSGSGSGSRCRRAFSRAAETGAAVCEGLAEIARERVASAGSGSGSGAGTREGGGGGGVPPAALRRRTRRRRLRRRATRRRRRARFAAAAAHVMSPAGAPLRETLVADALETADAVFLSEGGGRGRGGRGGEEHRRHEGGAETETGGAETSASSSA